MRRALLLLAPLALLGCDNGSSTAKSDLGAPDLAAPDLAPSGPCPDKGTGACVTTVDGKVVDAQGAPVTQRVVSVCAGTCFFGMSGADGRFTVNVNSHIAVDKFALLLHGRPDLASYYLKLPAPSGMTISYPTPLPMVALPSSGPLLTLDGAAQMPTSGDVQLLVPAGATVMLDVEDCTIGDGGGCAPVPFRAQAIADPRSLPFVDPAAPPDALYAVAPYEALLGKKVGLSIANRRALPAGAAVDVLVQHGLAAAMPPAGALEVAALAHVSQDGTRIVTDAGEGVTVLGWIALKKR